MTQERLQFTSTAHPEKEGKTQKQKLLNLLSDKEWHDTVEILNKVYNLEDRGIARVGARIYDLKKDGIEIESRKKKKTVWEYRILNK